MFTWPSVAADRPLPKNMPAWSYQLKRWPQEARLGEWCPSFEAQNHRRWHSTNSRARSVQTESSRKDTVEPQSGCPALQAASETEDRPRDVRVVAEQEKCALYIPQSRSKHNTLVMFSGAREGGGALLAAADVG